MSGTKLEEFETTNHHQIQKLRYKWHMSKFLKKKHHLTLEWPLQTMPRKLCWWRHHAASPFFSMHGAQTLHPSSPLTAREHGLEKSPRNSKRQPLTGDGWGQPQQSENRLCLLCLKCHLTSGNFQNHKKIEQWVSYLQPWLPGFQISSGVSLGILNKSFKMLAFPCHANCN